MAEQLALNLELGVPDVEIVRGGPALAAVRFAPPTSPYARDRMYVWRRGRSRLVRNVRVRMRGVL